MNTNHTTSHIDNSRGRTSRARAGHTMRAGLLLAVPAVATVSAIAAPVAEAATPITCGTVVTADIRLTADLLDCPGSGLVIGASGVTIVLAGHTIDGTGSGAGIDNEAGHDDVQVRGGTIREFLFGVHLFETDEARLARLTVDANAIGVVVERSQRVVLDHVSATASTGNGIEITFSDRVTVGRSSATGNGLYGIVDRFSSRSRHERNTLEGNAAPGLTVDRTDRAVIVGNRASGNSDGIQLVGVEDALVARNQVTSNAGNGISVDHEGNTLTRNAAHDNGGFGIEAAAGTFDGGSNRASGNLAGDCSGVACR